MVLAVEVFVSADAAHGAGFEQNLLVTADGCELLSARTPARWAR